MKFENIKGVQLTWDSKRQFLAELSAAWGVLKLLQADLKTFASNTTEAIRKVWDDTTFQLNYICDNCPKVSNADTAAEMEQVCSKCIYQQYSHAVTRTEDNLYASFSEAQKNLDTAIELLDFIIKDLVNGKDED